jgi:acyl-CoA synthetase (NDP forming)
MNRAAVDALRENGIPVLEGTRSGLRAIRHLLAEGDFHERPPLAGRDPVSPAVVERWRGRLSEERPLAESEALSLISAWGIPTARSMTARNEEDALAAACEIGWPVALKTAAGTAVHKSDLAGVAIGLGDPASLLEAYRRMAGRLGPAVTVQEMAPPGGVELALGVVDEPGFGPVVVVGAGGHLVELIGDRRLALPPLDSWRARRLLDGLKMRPTLDGFRGRPAVDVEAVVTAVTRISALAADLAGYLGTLDVNPLIANEEGCVAVDALASPISRRG